MLLAAIKVGANDNLCSHLSCLLTLITVVSPYMSNGKCQDNCKSAYVFAVIQGQDCWCTNFAPENTVSNSECNTPCPGYPAELCGNPDSGLYGYFNLGGIASGTAGGSSPSSPATLPSPNDPVSTFTPGSSTGSSTETTFALSASSFILTSPVTRQSPIQSSPSIQSSSAESQSVTSSTTQDVGLSNQHMSDTKLSAQTRLPIQCAHIST